VQHGLAKPELSIARAYSLAEDKAVTALIRLMGAEGGPEGIAETASGLS